MRIIFTEFAVDIYFYFDILLPHILVCNMFISRYHGKLKVWASSVKFKSSIIASTSFLQSFVMIDKIVVKLEQLQCFRPFRVNYNLKVGAERLNFATIHWPTFASRTMLITWKFGYGQTFFPSNEEVEQTFVFKSAFTPLLAKNVDQCCNAILDYLAPAFREGVVVKSGNALPHMLTKPTWREEYARGHKLFIFLALGEKFYCKEALFLTSALCFHKLPNNASYTIQPLSTNNDD